MSLAESFGFSGALRFLSVRSYGDLNEKEAEESTPRVLVPAHSTPTDVLRVWATLREEAIRYGEHEPVLWPVYKRVVLDHSDFGEALVELICDALACVSEDQMVIRTTVAAVIDGDTNIATTAAADLFSSFERNPAATSLLSAFLYAKGFAALVTHRICHRLWVEGRSEFALHIHGLACRAYSVDIHPAAIVGTGVFIDHASGLVVGETCKIGNNVSILHGVTLGGTGKESGDRHPKIGDGVLLGAHATVLGNISIGTGSKIGAGSVVLKPVPNGVTVAGVPACIVKTATFSKNPSLVMDQIFI